MLIAGAHMSVAKGFEEAAREAVEVLGANALQLFLKSPRGRGVTKLTPEEADRFRAFADANRIRFTVAHASYLINLAKPLSLHDPWPLQSLVEDLHSMALLGGKGVVLHHGKFLELPYEKAAEHFTENLKRVLDMTADLPTHIILENMSGQGTEMGLFVEELAAFDHALEGHDRVSFCVDTCHAFAAGYALHEPKGVTDFFDLFSKRIGLQKLSVIHFNDSLKPFNSRRDRHQNLGVGEIGQEGLTAVAKFAEAHQIPLILETPEDTRSHREDLEVLRGWLTE